jgi:hypothetical protein
MWVDIVVGLWLDNDMNAAEITSKISEARNAFETATTKKARNEAAEELEFWTNKNAALHIATTNGWAF